MTLAILDGHGRLSWIWNDLERFLYRCCLFDGLQLNTWKVKICFFQSQLRISKTLAFHQFWTNFLTSRESKTFFVKWYGYFYCIKYICGSEVSTTFPLATIQRVKVELLTLKKRWKRKFCFSKSFGILEISGFSSLFSRTFWIQMTLQFFYEWYDNS